MQMGILEAHFHITSHKCHVYCWDCCIYPSVLSASAFVEDHLVSNSKMDKYRQQHLF